MSEMREASGQHQEVLNKYSRWPARIINSQDGGISEQVDEESSERVVPDTTGRRDERNQ